MPEQPEGALYDSTRRGFSPSEIPADWTPRDTPTPFFVRSADRLFRAVERAITSGRIDARSEIGDAALDYREIRQEMADASVQRYSWTQPMCGSCFLDLYPGRQPVRLKHAESERCCRCGEATSDGIYIRIDPSTVPHPSNLR